MDLLKRVVLVSGYWMPLMMVGLSSCERVLPYISLVCSSTKMR